MKKNRALFHAVAIPLVLALTGCATLESTAEADKARGAVRLKYPNLKVCPDASCDVTVTATACDPNAITATPTELGVVERPMVLVWTISSPDYTFDSKKGIYFKDDPDHQFRCKPKHDSEVVFHCINMNVNKVATPYSYGMNLVYKKSQSCHVDPIIINGY